MKEVIFEGLASGDHDGFCFDIDKEQYLLLTGRLPEEQIKSFFNDGLYRFYMQELLDYQDNKKFRFSIKIEEID